MVSLVVRQCRCRSSVGVVFEIPQRPAWQALFPVVCPANFCTCSICGCSSSSSFRQQAGIHMNHYQRINTPVDGICCVSWALKL